LAGDSLKFSFDLVCFEDSGAAHGAFTLSWG